MDTRTLRAVIGLALCAATVSAQDAPPAGPVVVTPSSPAPMPQYEQPTVFPSISFLPASFLIGPGYQIDPTVYNDGIYNTWRVVSDSGVYEVTGNERLLICLREIAAIQAIESEGDVKRFADGMKNAGEEQLRAAQNVLRNPGRTIKEIPQGAGRLLGRVGNTVKHAATGQLDTGDGKPGDNAKRLIGVDKAKRQLAAQLGVNPYSENAALQKALNDAAWAQSLGNVAMKMVTSFAVPPGLSSAITGIDVSNRLTKEQIEAPREDLEKTNRKALVSLGVPGDTIDALFGNGNFDPWTLSAMINALASLKLNDETKLVIAEAATATSDVDAYFFLRVAELMADYNKSVAPVTKIERLNNVIIFYDKAGKLVAPVWLDYLQWTPRVDDGSANVVEKAKSNGASGVVLLATGDLSPLAAEQLKARGIEVVTRAFLSK